MSVIKFCLIAFFLNRGSFLVDHLDLSTVRTSAPARRMSAGDDILSLDAQSLSLEMKSSRLTSVELMEATLKRIHECNPLLGALINLLPDEMLLEQARTADKTPRRGWLHGIPVAIKDLSNAKGFPTTLGGSPLIHEHNVAKENDDFVQRLIDAGAIVIGKTNAPEHGLGSHTFNSKWGTTVNPYSPSKSAGGSSGGAAVAIATRMLCFADGSDMMGSLRNPAGWNNLYSLRPTAGMISSQVEDKSPLSYPISTVGPMARTPCDLALLLETMAPPDSHFEASSVLEQPNVKGMRIGWLGSWGGAYVMEPGIESLCRDALDRFQETGVTVQNVDKPLFDAAQLWASWTTIRSKIVSTSAIADYGSQLFLRSDVLVKDEYVWEVKRGMALKDSDVAHAATTAREWSECLASTFSTYDALALPTAQVWPFDATLDWPKSIASQEVDTYHRWMEVVVPCSLAGLPCVTIPAGFGEEGLPMGIQLMGARGSDAKLLSLAQAYHTLTDWPSRHPPDLKALQRQP